jgi:hypothetical protein
MVNRQAIDQAVGAHGIWKSRLRTTIARGTSEIPVSTIRADDQCVFGKWLFGQQLSEADRATANYRTVLDLHAKFHETAARVVELALAGNKEEAEALLNGEFTDASFLLTSAMMDWKQAS